VAASNNANGSTAAWVIGVILVLALLASLFRNDKPSSSGTPTPRHERTEDKLRRVYDSQGIKYDDRMIREDARAIEELHREFGNK